MAIEDEPDAESEIIERMAKLVPEGTPIGVSLDLHGLVTERMLKPNVFVIGYRDYPHIDMFETGRSARGDDGRSAAGENRTAHGCRQAADDCQSVEGPYG